VKRPAKANLDCGRSDAGDGDDYDNKDYDQKAHAVASRCEYRYGVEETVGAHECTGATTASSDIYPAAIKL
jgi:hypothetical protein